MTDVRVLAEQGGLTGDESIAAGAGTDQPGETGPGAAGKRPAAELLFGLRLELQVGAIAPGGHFISHVPDGRVVFVRHGLPGERVIAEVTEEHSGYLRADVVQVLDAAPERVSPPCPYAGTCGGCDFQHVAAPTQRELKAAVLREQLVRLGRLTPTEVDALGVQVAELPAVLSGTDPGTGAPALAADGEPAEPVGWRTRVRYAVDATGRAGLLSHRSHQVVPVDRCRIAHPAIQALDLTSRSWPVDDRVEAIAGGTGEVTVLGAGSGLIAGPAEVHERALGRDWRLPAEAFWQVHPAAADTLAAAVLDLLKPAQGERAWDLYGGAGLFAAALAPRVGMVTLVEADRVGAAAARTNLADLANVRVIQSTVQRFRPTEKPDLVVLDPPRAGAGAPVVRMLTRSGARAVAYVACDPASFARDVATFRERGWRLAAVRGYDAFPMTHHVECIGLLVPDARQLRGSATVATDQAAGES